MTTWSRWLLISRETGQARWSLLISSGSTLSLRSRKALNLHNVRKIRNSLSLCVFAHDGAWFYAVPLYAKGRDTWIIGMVQAAIYFKTTRGLIVMGGVEQGFLNRLARLAYVGSLS